MSDWKEKQEADANDAMKSLVNLTNAYGSEEYVSRGILQALTCQHPTLQQSFWRTMQRVMKSYAKHEYVDGRNEASRDFCKAVLPVIEDHGLPLV